MSKEGYGTTVTSDMELTSHRDKIYKGSKKNWILCAKDKTTAY